MKLFWFLFWIIQICALEDESYRTIPPDFGEKNPPLTILCLVPGVTTKPTSLLLLQRVYDSWCHKCDQCLFVVDSLVETELNLVDLKIRNDGKGFRILIPKMYESWKYVYLNYIQQYDWFLKAEEDTWINMGHFRRYLYTLDDEPAPQPPPTLPSKVAHLFQQQQRFFSKQTPLYIGRRFRNVDFSKSKDAKGYFPMMKWNDTQADVHEFNAGGAYALNRAALELFGASITGKNPQLRKYVVKGKMGNHFDIVLARCLQQLGIFPLDTRDEEGMERFQMLTPNSVQQKIHTGWYQQYSFDLKPGISSQTISFHTLSDHTRSYNLFPSTNSN